MSLIAFYISYKSNVKIFLHGLLTIALEASVNMAHNMILK